MSIRREVEVLIVGGGGSGLTASMLLSSYGVSTTLVSRYPQTSNLPKASGLSIKTMEIFRELGLEDEIRAIGTPPENMRFAGFYAGLAGPHEDYGRTIARIAAWGQGGRDIDWHLASTVGPANLQQSLLEPLMKARAEALAPGSIYFNNSFLRCEQTPDGIVATIEDRATGETYEVAARYLLACDGGRAVGPQLGVQMEGHLAVATSVSVHFTADLSRWYRDDEAFHAIILNPDVGIPCAILPIGPERYGRASTEWVVHLMSFSGDHKAFDDAKAEATLRACLGLPDLDMQIHVVNRWPLDAVVASRFREGSVFMLGDAAHRMPPAGGHGLNTAIGDAYNLCWKLAEVLKGRAPDRLLDTYSAERKPVAERTVSSVFAGWHKNREMAMTIGFSPKNDPQQNWANIRALWAEGPQADTARRHVARALRELVPNFSNLRVGFGYVYDEGAIVAETRTAIATAPLAVYEPSTRPGHSMPDVWLEDLVDRTALGDLLGRRFALIAGEEGGAWVEAARLVARARGIPLDAFTVGTTEGDWMDMRDAWRRVREIGPAGAIVVRPDRFVAWRSAAGAADCVAALNAAFDQLLGHAEPHHAPRRH